MPQVILPQLMPSGSSQAAPYAASRMPTLDSSVISRAFYDAFARELDIVFTSGKPYRYFDVPSKVYRELMAASSKGEFFNQHIRDRYAFERL